ncbi:MAG: hypothetical protein ACJA08_002757 [Cyclobacteriaceae bacterium]|jgi:hypothetical protein
MVKAINVLKVISAFVFLVTLLFVYSFLPVMVTLNPEDASWAAHKGHFFYGILAGFILLNIFLLILERMLNGLIQNEEIRAWIKGLAFVLNLYLSFIVGYVGVMNNSVHFQNGSYGYLNYLGPIIIFGWISGLIFLATKKHKTS